MNNTVNWKTHKNGLRVWKLKPWLTLVEIHREISTNSCKVLSVTGFSSQLDELPRCIKLQNVIYIWWERQLCEHTRHEYIARIEFEISYVGNEEKKRSAKKENAEYLTMGETWRCYITWKKVKRGLWEESNKRNKKEWLVSSYLSRFDEEFYCIEALLMQRRYCHCSEPSHNHFVFLSKLLHNDFTTWMFESNIFFFFW